MVFRCRETGGRKERRDVWQPPRILLTTGSSEAFHGEATKRVTTISLHAFRLHGTRPAQGTGPSAREADSLTIEFATGAPFSQGSVFPSFSARPFSTPTSTFQPPGD